MWLSGSRTLLRVGVGVGLQRAVAEARALYEEAHPLLLTAAHSMPAGALSAAQTHLQLRATQLAAARLPLLEQVAQMLAKCASRLRPLPLPLASATAASAPLYSAGDLARVSRLAAAALQISEQYAALVLECVDADGDTIDYLQKYSPLATRQLCLFELGHSIANMEELSFSPVCSSAMNCAITYIRVCSTVCTSMCVQREINIFPRT